MRTFGKADLGTYQPRNSEMVPAPEIADDVQLRVRGLMSGEYLALHQKMERKGTTSPEVLGIEFIFDTFRGCVIDDDGTQVFADADEKVAEQFPFSLVQRVVETVMRLSEIDFADLPDDIRTRIEAAVATQDDSEGKGRSRKRSGASGSA